MVRLSPIVTLGRTTLISSLAEARGGGGGELCGGLVASAVLSARLLSVAELKDASIEPRCFCSTAAASSEFVRRHVKPEAYAKQKAKEGEMKQAQLERTESGTHPGLDGVIAALLLEPLAAALLLEPLAAALLLEPLDAVVLAKPVAGVLLLRPPVLR